MDQLHRSVIRNCRLDILEDLHSVKDLLDYLRHQCIFSPSMAADVMAERTEKDKARKLVDDLIRRGPRAYGVFVDGLRHSSYDHLAEMLIAEETRLRQTPPGQPFPLGRTVFGPSQSHQDPSGTRGPGESGGTLSGHPMGQPSDKTIPKYPYTPNLLASQQPQLPHPVTESREQQSVPMETGQPGDDSLNPASRSSFLQKYRMESVPRGYVLIIKNSDLIHIFTAETMDFKWIQPDIVPKLKALRRNLLAVRYITLTNQNPELKEILEEMEEQIEDLEKDGSQINRTFEATDKYKNAANMQMKGLESSLKGARNQLPSTSQTSDYLASNSHSFLPSEDDDRCKT